MSTPNSDALYVFDSLAVNVPPGVLIVTWPPGPETWMALETRQTANPNNPDPIMTSPTNMVTIIRTLLIALLPALASGAAGWAGATTAAPAAYGVPHAVQNCLSGDTSAPHFAQKLAMMISLSFSPHPGLPCCFPGYEPIYLKMLTTGLSFSMRFQPQDPGRPERAVSGTQTPGTALHSGELSDTSPSAPLRRPERNTSGE